MTEPSTLGNCEYYENYRRCANAADFEVAMLGRKVGLCDRHARPEFHPRDLHKRLPGAIRRTLRRQP